MTVTPAPPITTTSLARYEQGEGPRIDLTAIHTSALVTDVPAYCETLVVASSSTGWTVHGSAQARRSLHGPERMIQPFTDVVVITDPDGHQEALISSGQSTTPETAIGQAFLIDGLLLDVFDTAEPSSDEDRLPDAPGTVGEAWLRVERLHALSGNTRNETYAQGNPDRWQYGAAAIRWAGFPSAQAATAWVSLFRNNPVVAAEFFHAGLTPEGARAWHDGRVPVEQVPAWESRGWTGRDAEAFELALGWLKKSVDDRRDRARLHWRWRRAAKESGQSPARILDAVRAGLSEAEFDQVCESGDWGAVAVLAALGDCP